MQPACYFGVDLNTGSPVLQLCSQAGIIARNRSLRVVVPAQPEWLQLHVVPPK